MAALPVALGPRPKTLVAHRPLGISRSPSRVPHLHCEGSLPHHLSALQHPQEGGITLGPLFPPPLSTQPLTRPLPSPDLTAPPGTSLRDIALLNSSNILNSRNSFSPLPQLPPALWLSAAHRRRVNASTDLMDRDHSLAGQPGLSGLSPKLPFQAWLSCATPWPSSGFSKRT